MSTSILNTLLNAQSQTPTPAGQKMQVVMVPRELIMANPDNRKIYIVGDVSGLKDDIRENGVRQPLEVIRWANGYKLIGGERRLTACKQLADEGDKRFESLPCLILDSKGEMDDKIALITANATARDLTDGERVAQYEALKDALTQKKKAGQLEGKVRDECCRILGLSSGVAARLNVIATCENETIKLRLMAGEIGLMEAYRYAQDYAQYTKQKEAPEEPEEPPKTASVETLPKTVPEYPEWVVEPAKEVCKIEWVKNAPDFTADALIKSKGGACGGSLTHGFVDFGRDKIRFWGYEKGDYSFTWAKFVRFCIEKGIAPEKHAAKSAAKPVESAKPAADLAAQARAKPFPRDISNRGLNTLIKLARKTLDDKKAWTLYLSEPEFRVEYYKQSLPGGATLWMRLDEIAKERMSTAGYVDYAIILQDKSFYTDGWIGMGCIVDDLVKWFNLTDN